MEGCGTSLGRKARAGAASVPGALTAKYASAFYGPFREATDSQLVGDRRTYQQDPAHWGMVLVSRRPFMPVSGSV